MLPFDRVVLSTDEHPFFLQYWPLVATAWRTMFPQCKITCAFVTDRNEDDPLILQMKAYGDVVVWRCPKAIPSPNFARVVRYLEAGRHPYDVCLIHDMDSLPLQPWFLLNTLGCRPPACLFIYDYGIHEGDSEKGKFQIGNLTGDGFIFGQMFQGPWDQWPPVVDSKESPRLDENTFCDESMLRALVRIFGIACYRYAPNVDIKEWWLDRGWWPKDGALMREKLRTGKYLEANLPRPFDANMDKLRPVVEHICGPGAKPEDIILRVEEG